MKKFFPYIVILLLVLGLTACGKKGPPVPPADDEPKQEKQESSYP
jgi:predicted small lipoprotein YifL